MTLYSLSKHSMARRPVIWFLVADGLRAQIYTRDPDYHQGPRMLGYEDSDAELVPVTGMLWQQDAENETSMSRKIALPLDAALRSQIYDQLVLIAPDSFLEELKKHLSVSVLDCVTAELPEPTTRYEPEPDLIIEFEFM